MCGCAVTVNRLITPSLLHHIVVFFYSAIRWGGGGGGGHLTTGESQYPRIYRPRVRIQYPDRIYGGRIVSTSVIYPGRIGFSGGSDPL